MLMMGCCRQGMTVQSVLLLIVCTAPFCVYVAITVHDTRQLDITPSGQRCPLGTFACDVTDNNSLCIEQQLWCDGEPHCPSGQDELLSECLEQTLQMDVMLHGSVCPQLIKRPFINCSDQSYPDVCKCTPRSIIECNGRGLAEVPRGLGDTTNALSLEANNITRLLATDFTCCPHLSVLVLGENRLSELEEGAFEMLPELQNLHLSYNRLTDIRAGTFRGLRRLAVLLLDHNRLQHLSPDAFDDLAALCYLSLRHNELTMKIPEVIPNAIIVELNDNRITRVNGVMFSRLTNAVIINLADNQISDIELGAFRHTKQLLDLNLSSNRLSQVPRLSSGETHTLQLHILSVAHNPITTVNEDTFTEFGSLKTLNMSGLELEIVDYGLFQPLTNLSIIEFKTFEWCRYVPTVRVCHPIGDGISSIANLLDIGLLRVCIWVVALTTCIGNLFVMVCRVLFREEKNVHSLFIKNLAAADLMMGVYLLLVASHDVIYREQYNRYALLWMNSWGCQATGFVSVLSCEASICLLVTMSIECCAAVSHPYRSPLMTLRRAYVAVIAIWTSVVVLAAVPTSFSRSFYGSNGVCLPLHVHDPFRPGWQYSAVVFLGINLVAVLLVGVSYASMGWSLHRTRLKCSVELSMSEPAAAAARGGGGRGMIGSGSVVDQNRSIAKRFFAIVLTNVLCWIPICVIKMLAFADVRISDQFYAWLSVFVLPINSALNPLIYTFSTPSFRRKFRDHFTWRTKLLQLFRSRADDSSSADKRRPRSSSKITSTVTLLLHDATANHRQGSSVTSLTPSDVIRDVTVSRSRHTTPPVRT